MNKETNRTICKTQDVPVGSAKLVLVDKKQIAVFNIAGEFFALDNRCPHAGASLAHGIIKDETVYCRIHHWQFRIRDGCRIDDDCPNSNATSIPIRVNGDEIQLNATDLTD